MFSFFCLKSLYWIRRQIVKVPPFNSFCIARYYKFASKGFTISTHTTSLTFDLTSDQKQLSRNRENFHGEKKGRTLQESNRGGSLSRMGRCNVSCVPKESLELQHIQ